MDSITSTTSSNLVASLCDDDVFRNGPSPFEAFLTDEQWIECLKDLDCGCQNCPDCLVSKKSSLVASITPPTPSTPDYYEEAAQTLVGLNEAAHRGDPVATRELASYLHQFTITALGWELGPEYAQNGHKIDLIIDMYMDIIQDELDLSQMIRNVLKDCDISEIVSEFESKNGPNLMFNGQQSPERSSHKPIVFHSTTSTVAQSPYQLRDRKKCKLPLRFQDLEQHQTNARLGKNLKTLYNQQKKKQNSTYRKLVTNCQMAKLKPTPSATSFTYLQQAKKQLGSAFNHKLIPQLQPRARMPIKKHKKQHQLAHDASLLNPLCEDIQP